MQAWRVFEAKGFKDFTQCENMFDFNVLIIKMDFDIIQVACDLNV
jgi:hypothetical protein